MEKLKEKQGGYSCERYMCMIMMVVITILQQNVYLLYSCVCYHSKVKAYKHTVCLLLVV